METYKFKVGDYVKVIKGRGDIGKSFNNIGKTGFVELCNVIRGVEHNSDYEIKLFGETCSWLYSEDEIELVEKEPIGLSDTTNPSHYKKGKVECIEAIKAATVGKSGFEGYLVGNVIKYLWRYEEKGKVEDQKKALWYLNKLIDERTT